MWFLLAAFIFYLIFMSVSVYQGSEINEELSYKVSMFPALLLIFYPATFGIQNDYDQRILEILFGIPNYRYKIWLVRMVLVYVATFLMMVIFSIFSYYLLYANNPFEMAFQIMFPVVFLGNVAFWLSTVIRNGSGTAIVMIVLGIGIYFLSLTIANTSWDIFINPFRMDENMNVIIWERILLKNRIYLVIGAVVTLLLGLLNLQKRERFVG